jgi:UDP-N-acetylenolpyruvoylglucosamine reductase
VIVAGEGASGSDVLALSRLMKLKVFHRFGIVLTPEVVGL